MVRNSRNRNNYSLLERFDPSDDFIMSNRMANGAINELSDRYKDIGDIENRLSSIRNEMVDMMSYRSNQLAPRGLNKLETEDEYIREFSRIRRACSDANYDLQECIDRMNEILDKLEDTLR
jgi:DNA repair ATPase RecN